jgi:hypothetical protein
MTRKERYRELKITLVIAGVLLFSVLLSVNFVSAEFWGCFERGEIIDFCNSAVPDRTCKGNGCFYCMDFYDEENNCYLQGNFNICNGIPRSCSVGSGTAPELDKNPPSFDLINPIEGGIYSDRSFPVIFELDEKADVYYMDNVNRPGRWTRVCNDCTSGNRRRSFRDGFNHLTFRYVDVIGNEGIEDVTFRVDSIKPRISRTDPRRGFASGVFSVEFREENPDSLILRYGNDAEGMREREVDFENECEKGRRGIECETFTDIGDFDGQEILYWFELKDIAGSIVKSRDVFLKVDTTDPEFLTIVEKNGRSVTLELGITEMNFDRAVYEILSDSRPRERTLCSRLRDVVGDFGTCERRIRLREGTHTIALRVRDDAGNSAPEEIIEITV